MATAVDVVREHAQTLAASAGLELVDVEVKGSGPRTLVRVRVDRKGGVELAECQKVSRDLSRVLDDLDPIDSRYQLEVTSPGVDYPLRTARDFDRVEGRVVAVQHRTPEGEEQIKGTVRAAGDAQVVLDVDGDEVAVGYDDILKATQALPW
jgi:ribosome maturation factor RimP